MSDLDPDDRSDASESAREKALPRAEPQPKANGNGHDPRATIERLAAMDPVAAALLIKAEAAELGITATELKQAVSSARSEAKKAQARVENEAKDDAAAAARAAKDAAKAAKLKADADAKADKARDKADKDAVKARERERKAAERQARLDAQKATTLVDDDGDPLRTWVPPDPATLPEITVAGGERPAIADAALAHMKAGGAPFYQRGKELVRVCLTKLKTSKEETVLVPAIDPVPKPMMLRAMGLCAKWLAFDKHLDLVRIDPPSDLGDHVLAMVGEWPFSTLRGVISTQTMRHDGTLLTEPGYDRATGLVLFNPPKLPPMPPHPTKRDALEALAYLNGLLSEFDFAKDEHGDDGVSRSGAMSMLMTPVLRGMMEASPLHAISKPDAGSGGSYLQDLMSAIALGKRCATISLTLRNDEENEKRLSSAARLGILIIAIDNFTGTLMGDFLCQLVSQPMPMIRILGLSEMVAIPNNHCVVANGINITIGMDAIRRVVLIGLDPNMENPSEREFARDPVAEVLADRGLAVAAVLTIIRAYRLAGMPGKLKPRVGFTEWSDNVRSALVWLGWADCDDSIKTARADDQHHGKLVSVMTAWAADLTVGLGYRVSELITEANALLPFSADRIRPDLWEALFAVAGNNAGQLDATRLGNWLRDHKNRVVGKHKLLVDDTDKSRLKWKLAPL